MEKQITIKLQGNEYKVEFPSMGQLMDIESRKMALAQGQYGPMSRTINDHTKFVINSIDAFATFITLVDFSKDLKVDSIFDLKVNEAKEIMEQYNTVYKPWFDGWMEEINKIDK